MKKLYILFFILINLTHLLAINHRDSIDVTHYNINITIFDFSSKNIQGITYVTLTPKFENTNHLKLDLKGLKVENISSKNTKLKSWSANDSIITIFLKKSITTSDTITLKIKYKGHPIKDSYWGGFYFSSNDAFNMGVGMASVPHSFGRVWFPCNDNFTDKASYIYNITVPKKYTVSAGGIQLISKLPNKDKNLITFNWIQEKPIPTYLASIDIAEYSVIKDTYNGINKNFPIEIFSYKYNVENTKKSLVNLKNTLRIFEELFVPYPWDKIGYSQVSFTSGAMEHAENIAMASYAFNGTTKNETLLYHELSHSWFGNFVTCKSASDMWINEGWASYCEALFLEKMYSEKNFREYNRKRHFYVLNYAHISDDGYRSVANMDINYTYGTTVYKKGADVVHTLRFYLGDSLFFPAVKYFLYKYAFSNASTEDLKNTFSEHTKINLNDFFNFWLYSKGFPFFEITNWNSIKKDSDYEVSVKINQRLIGGKTLANSNHIDVFFIDSSFNIIKKTFIFSGESSTQHFILPFNPVIVTPDLNEHIADATIDSYKIISRKGTYSFDESLFATNVTNIKDSVFLRVTCNFIEPNVSDNQNLLVQNNYYWTIEGIFNKSFEAKGKFYITRLMDKNFIKKYSKKDIILVYRKSTKEKWTDIDYVFKNDYLQTNLKTGQFALAVKI